MPQIWSGGQNRIRLGGTTRSGGAVQTEGANKRAFWSSSRRLLAVVVSMHSGQPGDACRDAWRQSHAWGTLPSC